jgi:curved DNA-binding protein CbpA
MMESSQDSNEKEELSQIINLTHYDVLGVASDASYQDIKASFHRLARLKHPDKLLSSSSCPPAEESLSSTSANKEEFERIQLAWKCLGNPETRSAYDQKLYAERSRQAEKRAIPLTIRDDFQTAVDEETGDKAYVYDCRCGQELQLFDDEWDAENKEEAICIECTNCCFVYRVSGT